MDLIANIRGYAYAKGSDVPVRITNFREDVIFTYNVTWLGGEEPSNIVYELVVDTTDGFFTIPAYQFKYPGRYTITINAYAKDIYS